MAKSIIGVVLIVSSLFITIPSATGYARNRGSDDADTARLKNICLGKEKVAKVHLNAQDLFSGANKTVYEVARASITPDSATSFGQVLGVDVLLTAEPDINSQEVGRAQGLITYADLNTSAAAMNLNFVLTSGQYNGSTISILGRNEIMEEKRELPVVGGTGIFSFVRGYALTRTYSYDDETNYTVLE